MGKNIQYDLQVEANSSGILIDARQLREYFEIEYTENLGDILQEFIERLGTFIPTSIPNNVSEIEKNAMMQSLSKSDLEDPSKIYLKFEEILIMGIEANLMLIKPNC